MAEIRVRNLEDWVVDAFRTRSKRNHRSLEGELREFLTEEIVRTRENILGKLEQGLQEMEGKHGALPDSAEGIREDRNKRG